MNYLTVLLVFTCVVYSSAFVATPNKGTTDPNNMNNQFQIIVDAIKGLQTSVNASGKYMQSLGTKVYDLEKQMFIVQREQTAYQKRSEDKATLQTARFQKLENTLSKLQGSVAPMVMFSAEMSISGSVSVYCPSGYKLLTCSCVGTPYCRGAYIFNERDCTAYRNNSPISQGAVIKARVTCGAVGTVGDLTYPTASSTINPNLSCPTDYRMIACVIEAQVGEKYTEIPLGIISGGRCVPNLAYRADSPCYASAVCQKF